MNETTTTVPTMPSDQEVNALVLTSLFGWRWMKRQDFATLEDRTALIAGKGDALGYAPINWNPHQWSPSDANAPRFSDWQRCNAKREQGGFIATLQMPDFCEDRNLLPLLWEKVQQSAMQGYYARTLSEMGICGEWQRMTATPRQQTEAVLRTLGFWPTEWGTGKEEM